MACHDASLRVPDSDRPGPVAESEFQPIRTDGEAIDPVALGRALRQHPIAGRVELADDAFLPGRKQGSAIRRIGQGLEGALMRADDPDHAPD